MVRPLFPFSFPRSSSYVKFCSGWWFQPLWKILINWDDYSQPVCVWFFPQQQQPLRPIGLSFLALRLGTSSPSHRSPVGRGNPTLEPQAAPIATWEKCWWNIFSSNCMHILVYTYIYIYIHICIQVYVCVMCIMFIYYHKITNVAFPDSMYIIVSGKTTILDGER